MPRVVFWLGSVIVVLGVLLALQLLDASRGTLMAVIAGLLAAVVGSNEERFVGYWQRRRHSAAAARAD